MCNKRKLLNKVNQKLFITYRSKLIIVIFINFVKFHMDNDLMKYLKENILKWQQPVIKSVPAQESQYYQQYLQSFKHLKSAQPELDKIIQKLQQQSIKYLPSTIYQDDPIITIDKKSVNSEIVILMMKWGKFIQKISLMNFSTKNPYLPYQGQQRQKQKCVVYQKKMGDQQMIFKSQYFVHSSRSRVILTALKQVFIAKIASKLEFGPICCQGTFYDVFLYQDSIQFGMEKCVGYRQQSLERLNTDLLFQSLRIMHFLKIIHYDIKPDNIMFSQKLNKLVTIDFNLSDITDFEHGKKRPLTFRGTLNFCCPQMVQNFFLSNDFNLVDPYYNDIYCLRESLLFISQQLVEVNSYNIYIKPLVQESKKQDQYYLLHLKYLLFWQDWKKVFSFYTNNQSHFQRKTMLKIAQFMYELDFSEDLELFYCTFIHSQQRETLLLRYFNYFLTKKRSLSLFTLPANNTRRKEFQKRLDIHNMSDSKYWPLVNKEQCIEYLQDPNKYINKELTYFSIFLDLISYDCNHFSVDRIERSKIAKMCYRIVKMHTNSSAWNKILQKQQNKKQDKNEIQMMIRFILKWTIDNLLINKQQAKRKQQNFGMLRQALQKILRILFILDIGTLQQNIDWFKMILSAFDNAEEQYAAILSIKHLNIWNQYRLRGKKDHTHSRIYIFWKILEFIYNQMKRIQKELSKRIHSILLQYLKKNDEALLQENITNKWLKDQMKIQYIFCAIHFSRYDANILQKVGKNILKINMQNHSKFNSYYLLIYDHLKNQNLCDSIYSNFSQQLNDLHLQKQFNLYYRKRLLNLSLANIQLLFDYLGEYILSIQGQDILLNIEFLGPIDNLTIFLLNQKQRLKFQDYHILLKKNHSIFENMRKLYHIYHEKKKSLMDKLQIHICFEVVNSYLYLFNAASFQRLSDYQNFLKENQKIQYQKKCQRCQSNIKILYVNCVQNWLLNKMPENAHQMFLESHQQYQQIIRLSKHPYISQQILTGYQIQIYFNCAIIQVNNNVHRSKMRLYKNIRVLYGFVKQKKDELGISLVWIYYGLRPIYKQLLMETLGYLLSHETQQFLCFLQMLGEYLQKNLSQNTFNHLLYIFSNIIQRLQQKDKVKLLNFLRNRKNILRTNYDYFRIYLFVLAMFIIEPSLQKIAFFLVAKTLKTINLGFQQFYSSEIHRHFVTVLYWQGKNFCRKWLYLNNRMVKLFIRMGRRSLDQKKYPKFQDKITKILTQKLQSLEGPFVIDNRSFNKFWYQMKRKRKG